MNKKRCVIPFCVVDALLHTVERERRARRSLEALETAPCEILDRHAVAKVEQDSVIETVPEVQAGGQVLKEGREERLRVRRVIILDEGAMSRDEAKLERRQRLTPFTKTF
jgi:hypothetical protein